MVVGPIGSHGQRVSQTVIAHGVLDNVSGHVTILKLIVEESFVKETVEKLSAVFQTAVLLPLVSYKA